jgi:hypothetical protein
MFLFFSVARSQDLGQWERAQETAQVVTAKPSKSAPTLVMKLPPMSSAFDTGMLLAAA